MADEHVEEAHTPAPPPTGDAPVPGWISGMLWTLAAWALYYYIVAV